MAKIKLSEDLEHWRCERPDEWIMDRFIKKAKLLEEFVECVADMGGFHGAAAKTTLEEVEDS